jgi:hypothetical protein
MFIPASGNLDKVQSFEMILNFYQLTRHHTLERSIYHTVMWNWNLARIRKFGFHQLIWKAWLFEWILVSPDLCFKEVVIFTHLKPNPDFGWFKPNICSDNVYNISLICKKSVTTQNLWFFRRRFLKFWSAIIFYECNGDTTALQRRDLQTALWHYTC